MLDTCLPASLETSVFSSVPMALHGGELARRLVDRLYAATTTKEARLCKASLEALVGADIEGGAVR